MKRIRAAHPQALLRIASEFRTASGTRKVRFAPALMARLYLDAVFRLEFKRLRPHLGHTTACVRSMCSQEDAMFPNSQRSEQLAALARQVGAADEATSQLFSEVVVATARRLWAPGGAAKATQLHDLIEAGALTQAALNLIDLELPLWKLRRIAYDEGEWHCAMSRQREVPEWLDQAVEARHASLTLAILGAYIETVGQIELSRESSRPSVPQTRAEQYEPLYCENFA
jgi:hypothetical protein